MKHDEQLHHITPADGNVFLDLGFEPEEAKRLLAESMSAAEAELVEQAKLDISLVVQVNQASAG